MEIQPQLLRNINKKERELMSENRFTKITDGVGLDDLPTTVEQVHGHVIVKDADTGEILVDKDNLVLMRTRVWLFEQLFKIDAPASLNYTKDNSRSIALFSIGSGGADINANPFAPFVPKFSDIELGQRIPFVTVDPDKANNAESQANPSIVSSLTSAQRNIYYMPVSNSDGTTPYYAKRFKGATAANPFGSSGKWVIDNYSGKVAFSLSMNIDKSEARGNVINEIGLWMATYNSSANTFTNPFLATRICFDTDSLSSLNKNIEIEYLMYI